MSGTILAEKARLRSPTSGTTTTRASSSSAGDITTTPSSPSGAGSSSFTPSTSLSKFFDAQGLEVAAGTGRLSRYADEVEEEEDAGPATVGDSGRTPPPYSGPSSASIMNPHAERERELAGRNHVRFQGLPNIDYKLYSPPLFELSQDCTTLSTKAPYLSANVVALVNMIRQLATIPPKPQVHVTGTRGRKTDFAIKLNLMQLLVPDEADGTKRRMEYLRCVYPGELALRGGTKPDVVPEVGDEGLEGWARRFVEDSASIKVFTLERQVANLDMGWIEGQLRSLVAATKYKGNVTVTFPVTHARVSIHNPDRMNKFMTTVSGFFVGKRQYEVVKAVWPFATAANGESHRRCIVQTEEAWLREWRDPIRYCVATKRHGWVTNEDKLEAVMEGKGKGISIVDWGPDYEI